MKAESVINTNLGLTKMSNIFEHIQIGIFDWFLPPSVVKVLEDKKAPQQPGNGSHQNNQNAKKQKQSGKQ